MAHLIQPFINAGGSPSAQEMYRSTRHSFEFTPDAFSPFGYPKRAFNDFYLRDYLNSLACLMMWGSGMSIFLFADFFGDLNTLNAFCFAPHIKRKSERLFSLIHEPF